MYTKENLLDQLRGMGVNPAGTLMVHSSMKAIGAVEGGADTVLDALSEYMREGLLLLPTHTWDAINGERNVCDLRTEPSCVGILPELFRKRPGVVRSLHPTHSVAALGREAEAYIAGEENCRTPGPRNGCWGRLYDRQAQILFLGCPLKRNTFLHSVEEWAEVPNRLAAEPEDYYVIDMQGVRHYTPQYRHHTEPTVTEVSQRYDKMEPLFRRLGAVRDGRFGDAACVLGDAVRMADITLACLKKDIHLFDDDRLVPDVRC